MNTAIVFPGQGSQTPEMRDLVARVRPDLLELAVQVVGSDPFVKVDEGTAWAQPAIFCASIAGWTELGSPTSEFTAGHSLGELGALVAAGRLDEGDGLRLVTLRGALMQASGERVSRGVGGGMVALLGRDASERAYEIAAEHELSVANDNSPQQVVLSGARDRLKPAAASAESQGLRAMILPVTGAFHSPLMADAVEPFAAALAEVEIRPEGMTTVISAVTAEPFDDVRKRLVEALTGPVRWRETLLALHARGVSKIIDVGPGKVLTGLAKRTLTDMELVNAW
jgi:malonyl CoA-acyl carrier protein transacylase